MAIALLVLTAFLLGLATPPWYRWLAQLPPHSGRMCLTVILCSMDSCVWTLHLLMGFPVQLGSAGWPVYLTLGFIGPFTLLLLITIGVRQCAAKAWAS